MFNVEKQKNEIVAWIKDWFKINGPDCFAIVGISGGLDSSVVAALCLEALGEGSVVGVLMPDGEQSDIADSYALIEHLHIGHITINISQAKNAIMENVVSELSQKGLKPTEQTRMNLPPRIRMAALYAVSQSLRGRVANTSNLSETWVGWDTRWGDSCGDFSPLANLTKTEIKEIGKVLGLPKDLVEKTPIDGLCGKTDEEKFGFSYEVLDKYIRTGEIDDLEIKEKIDSMHEKNMFKTKPIEAFPYEL